MAREAIASPKWRDESKGAVVRNYLRKITGGPQQKTLRHRATQIPVKIHKSDAILTKPHPRPTDRIAFDACPRHGSDVAITLN